jgi:hypothetical protein
MCSQVYFKPSHRCIERELVSSVKTKASTPLHRITHPSPSLRAPLHLWYNLHSSICQRFNPGGSLDRRVNCCRVPQPRWVGARWSAKGGNQRETGIKGKLVTFVLSRAQVGCACSRGLQASAWEGARGLHAPSHPPRAANLLVRVPWAFHL